MTRTLALGSTSRNLASALSSPSSHIRTPQTIISAAYHVRQEQQMQLHSTSNVIPPFKSASRAAAHSGGLDSSFGFGLRQKKRNNWRPQTQAIVAAGMNCWTTNTAISKRQYSTERCDFSVDHLVIGAGVVGLAIAEKLAARAGRGGGRGGNASTLIVDKNPAVGQETSSRNSEVIHAGIYYPPNSLKTKLCIRGNELLYQTCAKYNIPHNNITKWVVAQGVTNESTPQSVADYELAYLYKLSGQALALGVPTHMIGQKEMQRLEPSVQGQAALVSPRTGIVDVHGLMQYLEMKIQEHGGDVVLNSKVVGIERLYSSAATSEGKQQSNCGPFIVRMETPNGLVTVEAATVINSAGLHANKVVDMLLESSSSSSSTQQENSSLKSYPLHYCKGHYFSFSGPSLVSRLIYPVPDKALTSLGTHLTLDLAGRMRFGPDVLYVDRLDDYAIKEGDLASSRQYLENVTKVIQKYLPGVKISQIYPDYAGIRPKLAAPGEGFRDFEIENFGDFIDLRGIESPGLTSSLAIAEHVEKMLY